MTSSIQDAKINEWVFQPLQKNNHGGLYFPITLKDGKTKPRYQIGDQGLRVPFGPTSYNLDARMSLDFSIKDPDTIKFFQSIDAMVLEWAWKNIESLFPKRKFTKEMLRECYCPLLTQKGDYDPMVKTKVNGSAIVYKIVDGNYNKARVEDIQAGAEAIPVCSFDRVWVMSGNRFGLTAVTQACCLWPKKEKGFDELFPFFPVPAG